MSTVYLISVLIVFVVIGMTMIDRMRSLTESNTKRGKSWTIAISGVLLCAAFFVIIPPVYAGLESAIPVPNGADLIDKVCMHTAVALLGGYMGKVFQSPITIKLTVGKIGVAVMGAVLTATAICFAFIDAPEPSPLLALYNDQPAQKIYTWITVLYVAYIAALMVPLTFKVARTNPIPLCRVGGALMCVGFCISVLRALGFPIEASGMNFWYAAEMASGISAIFVVVGLSFFAAARKRNSITKARNTLNLGDS